MKGTTVAITEDNPFLDKVKEVAEKLGIKTELGMRYLTEGMVKAVISEHEK